MIYKFDKMDGTVTSGYTTLVIKGGFAEVDNQDLPQVELAELLGGKPTRVTKKLTKPKTVKKESN